MKLKCSNIQHRLYWALDLNCPCVEQVALDFIKIGCGVKGSSELADQLYVKYPWLTETFLTREKIRHIYCEMLDAEEL